jgi:pimeloyl-ACP methyl ester carboxylesterase
MPQIRANGIDIEYENFGRVGDPTILFIMGFAAPLPLWPESLFNQLAARGFRVIRYDNRDIGKSTHLLAQPAPVAQEIYAKLMAGQLAPVPYTLDDMAADAVGLLDALGIARAHIVGASMGGMIAQLVAINHPAKTKSLTSIMSTTGRRGLPPAKPEAMTALMTPPAGTGRQNLIDAAVRVAAALGSPGYPYREAEIRARAERSVDWAPYEPTGIARQLAAIIVAQPRNDRLKSVMAPSLVFHGDSDPLFAVEHAADTANSIPGAELVIVPGMGHNCCEALVPVYLDHIGGFAAKVEGRP